MNKHGDAATTKVVPGILIATENAEEVAAEASQRIARILNEAIAKRGRASLALSGGNTPRAAYARLAHSGVDWSKVDIFWVDERAVPPTDERSNYRWAHEELIAPARIPTGAVHRMKAESADTDKAAKDYESAIRERVKVDADGVASFDVMVLGIGDDGHTASLFPGEVAVEEMKRWVVGVSKNPNREARMTMTPPLIEHARCVVVLAVGKSKSKPLERVWEVSGSLSVTPARIIRNVRGGIIWVIDKSAGGLDG